MLKGLLSGGKPQILIQLVLIRIIVGIFLLQPESVAYIDIKIRGKTDRGMIDREDFMICSLIPVIVIFLIFRFDFRILHEAVKHFLRVRFLYSHR